MEELGITPEVFKKMYDENNGFNNQFNKNHPSHSENETFLSFLLQGSERLVKENESIVLDIIKED